MKRKKNDNAPRIKVLYERLSREDDALGESGSIAKAKEKITTPKRKTATAEICLTTPSDNSCRQNKKV